jgi:hypothetical protein
MTWCEGYVRDGVTRQDVWPSDVEYLNVNLDNKGGKGEGQAESREKGRIATLPGVERRWKPVAMQLHREEIDAHR